MVSGGWLFAALGVLLAPPSRHPMHTSSAELVHEADSVRVAIRVFADDIATVGAVRSYLGDRFGIVDRSGQGVRLEWSGSEIAGDVLTIRMRGRVAGGLSGAKVNNQVLTDRFADQVNVVRAAYDRRAVTLIFTRGDGPKALP
jgi:uncharacterized protein DUF6702